MRNKVIFLPGLNGLRSIAAMGVMVSHINMALPKFGISEFSLFGFESNGNPSSWVLGEHGVTIFFVLSGFLITYLLLKEIGKTDTINLKSFYIRRILRIWPLYYLYLFITLLTLYLTSGLIPNVINFLYYVFFLANVPFVVGDALPALEHLWSIAVEEQFYIFWPILFILFKEKKLKKVIFIMLALLACFRIFIWYKYSFGIVALFSVVNRFDCMMLGGLVAILVMEKRYIIEILNAKFTQFLAWLIMVLLIANKFTFFNSIIEIFFVAFITGVIIVGQIKVNNRIVNLENKLCSNFGKLSFGIYIYHPIMIFIFAKYQFLPNIESLAFRVCLVFFLVIFSTYIVASFSYSFIEIKFLKLKHKFSVVESSNVRQ